MSLTTCAGDPERAPRGTLKVIQGKGFPPVACGVGETPLPVPQDVDPEMGDMWGKCPFRGDTGPGMIRGRVSNNHVTTL